MVVNDLNVYNVIERLCNYRLSVALVQPSTVHTAFACVLWLPLCFVVAVVALTATETTWN